MIINRHHIDYGDDGQDEWVVEIKGFMHKTLTIIHRTKPTPGQYAILTDYVHALMAEWNRYRKVIDTEDAKNQINRHI